jgi:hypothetical protein
VHQDRRTRRSGSVRRSCYWLWCSFGAVSEQQDVIADLEAAGVLAGVRWAYVSATTRTLDLYSEADGHDLALLGNLRFTTFRDRLDRVFACERYVVQPDSDAAANLDLLYAELSEQDVATMPCLTPDLVRRYDLNGSPGWACQGSRFLLASGAFGKLDRLPWPQKSPTKQRVARQRDPEPSQPSLFDGLADEEIGGLEVVLAGGHELDLVTLVVAHSLDPVSQQIELVLGRARLNSGGGQAWHWYQDLLSIPPAVGGRRDGAPPTAGPNSVPDAPVRLRRKAGRQSGNRASGER